MLSDSPPSVNTNPSSVKNCAYRRHEAAPLPTLTTACSPRQPLIFPALSVLMLPITNSPLFARVSPTFSLRRSARNPMYPPALFRTVEKMMISFSRPSKPSTVLISMLASCIARWSPRTSLKRVRHLASLWKSRVKRDICATYGAIMPMSCP